MLDAGGEAWPAVSEIITDRLEELGSGDVIEISSLEPQHRKDILGWCDASGYDLFQMLADGDRTWFWIKKR
jgi:TusA-related sulfurtransferase